MKKALTTKKDKPTYAISYIQGNKYIECRICGRRSFSDDHIKSKVCHNCGYKHK